MSINNPDPTNYGSDGIYTVKSGDCLWNIAMKTIRENGGNATNQAIAKELSLIEGANTQIIHGGSGTYDLIYPGDHIAIPNWKPGDAGSSSPSDPYGAATADKNSQPGFHAPTGDLDSGPTGAFTAGLILRDGMDILSENGKYDMVVRDGHFQIYQLATPYQRSADYGKDTLVWTAPRAGGTSATEAHITSDGTFALFDDSGKQVGDAIGALSGGGDGLTLQLGEDSNGKPTLALMNANGDSSSISLVTTPTSNKPQLQ